MLLVSSDRSMIRVRSRVENLVHYIACLRCHSVDGFTPLHSLADTMLLRLRMENFVADRGLATIRHCILPFVALIASIFDHEDLLMSRRDICIQRISVFAFVSDREERSLPVTIRHGHHRLIGVVGAGAFDFRIATILATHV